MGSILVFVHQQNTMRGSLGLLLALFVSGSLSIRVWEDGKEYLFKEEASVHVGTNDLNNTVTGFRFLSDVKVQVQADKMVVTKAKERKELPMELLTYIGDEKIEIMPKMR